MYVWSSHIAKEGTTGQGCQSCSWSAERGKLIFPCPRSRLRIGLARRVWQSRPELPRSISILGLNLIGCCLRNSYRFSRWRPFMYLYRHKSRVYRVTQLRTDGVHCREFADTGQVNLKVVPNEACLGRSPWTN